MITITYAIQEDEEFWCTLDRHLPEKEFKNKVRDKMAYVLKADGKPVGLLRYNLFWDHTPFCNLLFVDWEYQKKGYGKMLMKHWEEEMKAAGYEICLTSTQVNEEAQHFYRKIGYRDIGDFVLEGEPMELMLVKRLL
ncbi:MAG: GNAT family N-acetyltransferase [Lachnospiraceae bacterium]|nr:GNAT family N-acetyltransferase [Lachnospiraceae bacterium]